MPIEALTIIILLITTIRPVLTQLSIGAIHEDPEVALQLSVAVAVALRDEEIQDGKASFESGEPGEPLSVLRALCILADTGVGGVVIGGGGERVAAEAARAGVPIIEVEQGTGGDISLQPHEENIARATSALLYHKEWPKAVLLHEGPPPAVSHLLLPPTGPIPLAARRLPDHKEEPLLRDLLVLLKKGGARNFIVWCEAECTIRVLTTARRVGLLDERHSYILLALDPHQIPLDEFSYGGANITALRLFDPESERAQAFGEAWAKEYLSRLPVKDQYTARNAIMELAATPPAYLLLAYDGTRLLAQAWKELALPPVAAGSCIGRGFMHVETLVNHIRMMSLPTAAGGPLSFDADGGRRIAKLEVVELMRGGKLEHVARWQHERLEWRRVEGEPVPVRGDSMTNKTFNVLIAMNVPYVMLRQSKERLSGNDRYEGFCIELIDSLAKLLQFNYTFIEQKDREYGKLVDNSTNKWNGMIARLMDPDDDIDFAITDLTITAQREKVVDFTTPFMNLGISILFKRPEQPEPELFAFLLPFSNGVWLCLVLSYVGTSLVLLVIGRLCPEEWQNPHPCVDEPDALENQFTLANALWFNLGAVLLQGSEIAPIAYGTRAVASVWWLFALVITSSYTANLATLLAKKSTDEVIHNVEELANNLEGITYGAKAGGSTYTFFEQSQHPLYKQMYQHMKNSEMPKENSDGIRMVEEGGYAFLMESTTIEHLTQRNCKVQQVGGLLDNKGYGIAMRKNSTYRQALNLALLNLQERGVLREMKHQWWNEKHGGGTCNANDDDVESEELSMKNFLGLFLVLTVGSVLGVVYSFLDLVLHAVRRARSTNESFIKQLRAELRFVLQFSRSVKPLVLPIEDSPESTPSPETEVPVEESPEPPGSMSPRRDSQRSRRSRRRSTQHTIHNASVRLARHGRSS